MMQSVMMQACIRKNFAHAAGSLASQSHEERSPSTSGIALQRLLLDVFQRDVSKFREYCLDVEEWATGVEFLDQARETYK
jgi:hypothetical protein